MICESRYGFPTAVAHLPQTSLVPLCILHCVFFWPLGQTQSDELSTHSVLFLVVSDLSDPSFSGRDETEDAGDMEGGFSLELPVSQCGWC